MESIIEDLSVKYDKYYGEIYSAYKFEERKLARREYGMIKSLFVPKHKYEYTVYNILDRYYRIHK